LLTEYYDRLKRDIEKAKGVKTEQSKTEFKCPSCEKGHVESYLVKRFSKYGPFYSCEKYKKTGGCLYIATIGENGEPVEKKKKPPPQKTAIKCPKCGENMVIRDGRFGKFAGCPKYPKCNGIVKIESQAGEIP